MKCVLLLSVHSSSSHSFLLWHSCCFSKHANCHLQQVIHWLWISVSYVPTSKVLNYLFKMFWQSVGPNVWALNWVYAMETRVQWLWFSLLTIWRHENNILKAAPVFSIFVKLKRIALTSHCNETATQEFCTLGVITLSFKLITPCFSRPEPAERGISVHQNIKFYRYLKQIQTHCHGDWDED